MPSDERIWADYAKSVKRIKKPVKKSAVKKQTPVRTVSQKTFDLKPSASGKPDWIPAFAGMTLLDKRMERKLRAGELALEARLDMHGMSQREAHAALAEFISVQVNRGARNLLIITGKGRDGAGALKTNFKTWLESLPEASRILAVRVAAIKHGGTGAFYVILRKPSPP